MGSQGRGASVVDEDEFEVPKRLADKSGEKPRDSGSLAVAKSDKHRNSRLPLVWHMRKVPCENVMPIKFMRKSADLARFVDGICKLFLAAFPGRIRSVCLLGSRAIANEIENSDVDIAIVFKGVATPRVRKKAWDFMNALCEVSPVMMDLTVLDSRDLRAGVRPSVKIGKVVFGDDVLKTCKLKPRRELLAWFAFSALFFVWLARDKPKVIAYPLDFPDPGDRLGGYWRKGTCVAENEFRPGLNLLVNLVVSLANFRLALLTGTFVPNKSLTVSSYRRALPGDPWLKLTEETYAFCRGRLKGRLPRLAADRRKLARLCRRVLAFENECLSLCILNAGRLVNVDDADLRRRMKGFVNAVKTASPRHSRALAKARALASGSP